MIARAAAEELDRTDPLAGFTDRFVRPPGADRIYLNGNSLGPLPVVTVQRMASAIRDEWGYEQSDGWGRWLNISERVGDLLGRAALGAGPGQVVLGDSTSVQLYKAASMALDARPAAEAIVVDRGEFPTDRYVLEGLAASRGVELRYLDCDPLLGPQPEDIARSVASGDVALVCVSLVGYRSAAVADLGEITQLARHAGAFTLWDLSHAVGAIEMSLDGAGVDLAVGCTYKHLNGGPGAPAFLYVRREIQAGLRQPIQGWFGSRDLFTMGPTYEPADGVRRFLAGTPPVLALVAVEAALELLAEAGISRVQTRSRALTGLAIDLSDAWLAPRGVELGTPRDPARRGGHVALRHPHAETLCRRLHDAGVVADFRRPDVIRVGPALLATRFVEVWDAFDRLRRLATEPAVHPH